MRSSGFLRVALSNELLNVLLNGVLFDHAHREVHVLDNVIVTATAEEDQRQEHDDQQSTTDTGEHGHVEPGASVAVTAGVDRRRPLTRDGIVRPCAFPFTGTVHEDEAAAGRFCVWVRFEALTRCEVDFKPLDRDPALARDAVVLVDLDENPLRLADVGVHAVEGKVQHEAVTVAKAVLGLGKGAVGFGVELLNRGQTEGLLFEGKLDEHVGLVLCTGHHRTGHGEGVLDHTGAVLPAPVEGHNRLLITETGGNHDEVEAELLRRLLFGTVGDDQFDADFRLLFAEGIDGHVPEGVGPLTLAGRVFGVHALR